MPSLKCAFIAFAILALLPACATRMAVKPIPGRRRMMNIKNLFAMFMLFSIIVATYVFAEEDGQKFRDVFYPDGMPVVSWTEDGQTQYYQTVYQLYDELDIPNSDLKVVVFSKENHELDFADNRFYLYISIIQQDGESWNILYQQEISNYIVFNDADTRGILEAQVLNAVLNHFDVAGNDAVHLSLYALLSGSARFSSDSDIFFIIQDDNLTPVLELISDGGSGIGETYARLDWTFISLADIDSDGVIDILTSKFTNIRNDLDNVYVKELSDIYAYKFDNTENKYNINGTISELPSDAIDLVQAGVPFLIKDD